MDSVLEKLYKGELYPYSMYQPTIEEFKLNREQAFSSYTDFLAKLPEDLKDEFITFVDQNLNLFPLELEQNFIDGFRIGARMMTEVFLSPQTEETP